MSPTILYLSTVPGDLVRGMKFAGIRHYAAVRGWEAVAVPWETLRSKDIPTLLAKHSPVAGCVVEYSVDGARFPLSLFGAVPVVYLHPPSELRDGRVAYVATDNEAVARVAFRELSARRPAAYAVVGYRLRKDWSVVRMRVFAELAAEAHIPCHVFDDCGTDAFQRSAESMAALTRWVAALPRHTAIFAVNDGTAGEVVDAAHAARRHIPRELALCGVDNLPDICETKRPTITSIQIDFERAGFLAARLLAERMKGRAEHGIKGLAEREMKGRAEHEMKSAADAANNSSFGGAADTLNSRAARPSFAATPHTSFGGAADTLNSRAARHSFHHWADGGAAATVGPMMAVWRESTGGSGRREPHIMAAVERIRREACDGLTAQKVIEESPGSKRLFTLRFREATGHSVLDEIRHVRLEKVETLLSQTDTAIGAIADMCGWGSSVALERFFRAQTSMTMREWRRKSRS